jgi:uncharacterized PurR-regulated membrane protein YhhQ (DUF165 family)
MFKLSLAEEIKTADFTLTFLSMMYVTLVILSIILFNQILNFNMLFMDIKLSGAVVPYVFLYPISFIVLRIYGLQQVNHMIGAMTIVSLIFVIMSKIVVSLSSNLTGVHSILASSFKMYIAGFIGMPAGIYASFVCINMLYKIGLKFNATTLLIATIFGEIVNTLIVFPIGFKGQYSLQFILGNILVDALLFKVVMGAILAFITVFLINYIIHNKTKA